MAPKVLTQGYLLCSNIKHGETDGRQRELEQIGTEQRHTENSQSTETGQAGEP